jgi:prepilin-type processing-associated H-X9-DG protein
VVVAIIGLLIALLLPAVQMARESARRARCASNLRQVGLGLHEYHLAQRCFPIGSLRHSTDRIAWSVYLLPFVEEQAVFDLFHFDAAARSAVNHPAARCVVSVYLCPSTSRVERMRQGNTTGDRNHNGNYDPGDDMAVTDYGGISGFHDNATPFMNGILLWEQSVRLEQVTDGTSHTIFAAEDTGRGGLLGGEWANGDNIFEASEPINILQDNEVWSDHPSGAHVAHCDGSVRYLQEDTALGILRALCTRDQNDFTGP